MSVDHSRARSALSAALRFVARPLCRQLLAFRRTVYPDPATTRLHPQHPGWPPPSCRCCPRSAGRRAREYAEFTARRSSTCCLGESTVTVSLFPRPGAAMTTHILVELQAMVAMTFADLNHLVSAEDEIVSAHDTSPVAKRRDAIRHSASKCARAFARCHAMPTTRHCKYIYI